MVLIVERTPWAQTGVLPCTHQIWRWEEKVGGGRSDSSGRTAVLAAWARECVRVRVHECMSGWVSELCAWVRGQTQTGRTRPQSGDDINGPTHLACRCCVRWTCVGPWNCVWRHRCVSVTVSQRKCRGHVRVETQAHAQRQHAKYEILTRPRGGTGRRWGRGRRT